MNSKTKKVANPKLHLAVLAALPLMAMASLNVSAGCTGSTSIPYSASITEFCTGSDGSLTNSSSITSTLSVTNSNNALIQFEGLGKTLTNTGTIANNSILATGVTANKTRYGVFMGTATQADASLVGTSPGVGSAPALGATTVTIATGLGSGTGASSSLVGQTITFGRLDSSAGDFFTGVTKTITSYNSSTGVATFDSALSANYFGTSGSSSLPIAYNVISGSGVNTINNRSAGVISASIAALEITTNSTGASPSAVSFSNTSSAKAISMNIAGDYIINNAGSINASHAGVGGLTGIDGGGAVTNLTVNNSGTIAINRTSTLTIGTNSATSLKATTSTSSALSEQSIGSAGAVYAQEELEAITINNTHTGLIEATGNFTPAIYLRAGEQTIVNDGIIRTNTSNGFAIGSVSDGGEIRTLDLTNNGTITGDILAVNGNAVRWYTLSTLGTLDNRLNINSNWGQLDSTIDNTGTITGNLYFSNGAHELTNEDGATLTGNIDVDQRNTIASGQTPSVSIGEFTLSTTVVGAKIFTFENAGTYTGDITIRTATSTALGAGKTRTSRITLIPTITGSATGSSLAAPSTNIAGMGSVLTIDATAGVGTLAVAPKSLVTLKAGEYYKVANTLTLTGGATTPTVDNEYTPLVNWNIAKNGSNNLVIGVASIESAATVDGVTALSAGAIDALMTATSSTIGGSVQNLTLAEDIEHAGQQLRPEANNASTQAAMAAANQVSSVIGAHQESVRTASNGNSGVSTGETAQGAGFWMQGFGFRGDQKERGGIDGYTADTGGFVLGGDKTIGNGDVRLGAAFAYASTGIDGKGTTSANRTDIDSYQGTVYGSYNAGAWYVDAALGYGQHQYDTKRYVALAGASITGKHDANQYLAKVGVGYPLAFGRATFTPLASLAYVNLDQDGYTETDPTASGAALTVGSTKTDSLRSGLGAKVSVPLSTGKLNTALEARAVWSHEFADTQQDIASSFVGGNSFTTNGVAQARDSANLGLGVSLNSANGQTLSVNYDAEVKSDYVSHTAALKFRYDF